MTALHLLTPAELQRRAAQLEKQIKQRERDARNYELLAMAPDFSPSYELSLDDCYNLADACRRWAGEDHDELVRLEMRYFDLTGKEL